MEPTRTIKPGVGVDAFELGMTCEQLWALTDSSVRSDVIGCAPERMDTFIALGITVEYVGGRAHNFMVWPRLEHEPAGYASIIILDEDISRFGPDDLRALLQLHELSYLEESPWLHVRRLGLEFEFRQDHGQPEVLEWVRVAAPRDDRAD